MPATSTFAPRFTSTLVIVFRSWYAASKNRDVTMASASAMNVPGWGIPYVALLSATVVLRSPYCLMTTEPWSDRSGNVMPRRAEKSASTATGS